MQRHTHTHTYTHTHTHTHTHLHTRTYTYTQRCPDVGKRVSPSSARKHVTLQRCSERLPALVAITNMGRLFSPAKISQSKITISRCSLSFTLTTFQDAFTTFPPDLQRSLSGSHGFIRFLPYYRFTCAIALAPTPLPQCPTCSNTGTHCRVSQF